MDSVYKKLDQETQQTICNLFQFSSSRPTIRLIKTQKQKGSKDCGVFAIAFATTIAFGHNPTKQVFRQELMRAHLVHCLNIKQFSVSMITFAIHELLLIVTMVHPSPSHINDH